MHLFHTLNFSPVSVKVPSVWTRLISPYLHQNPALLPTKRCCTSKHPLSPVQMFVLANSGRVILLISKTTCFNDNHLSSYQNIFEVHCLEKLFQGHAYYCCHDTYSLLFFFWNSLHSSLKSLANVFTG